MVLFRSFVFLYIISICACAYAKNNRVNSGNLSDYHFDDSSTLSNEYQKSSLDEEQSDDSAKSETPTTQDTAKKEEKHGENALNVCVPTAEYHDAYGPESFSTSNNLLRKTGEPLLMRGKKMILKGVVLDTNCVPISDAKVYMWQVGSDGKYPYIPAQEGYSADMIDTEPASTFQGAGIATTDNNGEFYFVSVLPPTLDGEEQPYVNVIVEHHEYGDVEAKLYLIKNRQNATSVTSEVFVVLSGANDYREY